MGSKKNGKEMGLHEKRYSSTVPYPVTLTWLFPPVPLDFSIQWKIKRDKGKGNIHSSLYGWIKDAEEWKYFTEKNTERKAKEGTKEIWGGTIGS